MADWDSKLDDEYERLRNEPTDPGPEDDEFRCNCGEPIKPAHRLCPECWLEAADNWLDSKREEL